VHKNVDLCNFFALFLKKVAFFASEKRPFFDQKRAGNFCKRPGNFCKRPGNFFSCPFLKKDRQKHPQKTRVFGRKKNFGEKNAKIRAKKGTFL